MSSSSFGKKFREDESRPTRSNTKKHKKRLGPPPKPQGNHGNFTHKIIRAGDLDDLDT